MNKVAKRAESGSPPARPAPKKNKTRETARARRHSVADEIALKVSPPRPPVEVDTE